MRTVSHPAAQGDLAGAHVSIIGLGASGAAAARLALAKGGDVHVSDLRTDPATAARGDELERSGARVELGGHDVDRIASSALVVVSPGIPPDAPVLRTLAERGIRWVSEPELAFRFFTGPLIAVTGTNGKTTTTLLLGHLLEVAGVRAAVGGNVGGGLAPAACELALRPDAPDWYVLEMSSFQLAGIERLRPRIGVVTNLSPDHLDRYPSMEAYYADKARLFDNAGADSTWVLPQGDRTVDALAADAPGRRYRFGGSVADSEAHAFVDDEGVLTLRVDERPEPLLPASELPLLGRHNERNALAAALVARLVGAPAAALAEGLRSARPLAHRMEPVVERGDVLWVNDSKATNLAATRTALESVRRPVVLLLGGKDKGEAFSDLQAVVRGRARAVLAFGAAGARIARELGPDAGVELMGTDFREVVERAAALAHAGDMVLLSPACSSFDMFESYEHRGRSFSALVREVA